MRSEGSGLAFRPGDAVRAAQAGGVGTNFPETDPGALVNPESRSWKDGPIGESCSRCCSVVQRFGYSLSVGTRERSLRGSSLAEAQLRRSGVCAASWGNG